MPAETQVYLKDKGLTVLTSEAVYASGLIFVDHRISETSDDPRGAYTNLSARVTQFDPAALTYLNLDYNALTNVDALASFTGLRWLRLNRNRLKSLPDLSALSHLKRIYLRDNALTSVPETLRPDALPELDSIDLSGNPITEVPVWLAQRKGLAHLSLSNTRIVRLPDDLTAWRSLKTLQLGGLELVGLAEIKRIRAALPETTIVF